MGRKFSQSYYGYPFWFWGILLLGILLRVASLWWNDRLLGDINLFALTAREYAESGELNYPMKWDYSPNTTWGDLKTPQSQHPPLWSFMAGLGAEVFGTNNTYLVLQCLSLFSQCILLFLSFKILNVMGGHFVILGVSMVGLSPMLIDFAGNGSQYTLGTVFTLATLWLHIRDKHKSPANLLLSGVCSGLAFCTHGAFILVVAGAVLSTIIYNQGFVKRLCATSFVLLGYIVAVLPMILFRLEHFGSPTHSLNGVFFGGVFGKLSLSNEAGGVFWRIESGWSFSDLILYFENCLKVWRKFIIFLAFELSLPGIILALMGVFQALKQRIHGSMVMLIFTISYLVPILFWPGFRSRFLAPLLPLAIIFICIGIHHFFQKNLKIKKWEKTIVGSIFLWFGSSWLLSVSVTGSASRYYTFDLVHKENYQEMLGLVDKMKDLERGLVIGAARSLDGGMDAVYWHKFPYIHARPWVSGDGMKWETIARIRKDYQAKYFWTDEIMLTKYEPHMDQLQLIASSGKFSLFQFVDQDSS
jgi:4-amino-4-deoxy-L-arabinose transferase-like glycosyltransferase